MADMLGAAVDPIFTPPWNRCNQTTVDLLRSLPYMALSRDHNATALQLSGLAEIPVRVDLSRWERMDGGLLKLGQEIADTVATGAPIGIMLHHAAMSQDACNAVGSLLDLLRRHGQARCVSMMSLLAPDGSVKEAAPIPT